MAEAAASRDDLQTPRSPSSQKIVGALLQNWVFLEDSSKIGPFWRTPPKLVCSGGVLQNWCVLEESSKIGAFWRSPPELVRFGGGPQV